jgi:hypothetical protein
MAARREDERPGEGAMAEHWRAIVGGDALPDEPGEEEKRFRKGRS